MRPETAALVALRESVLGSDSKRWERKNPVASDLDPDSCLRRQVLEVAHWDEKPEASRDLAGRFEAGRLAERSANAMIEYSGAEAGLQVVEQQAPFRLAHRRRSGEVAVSGKIDGKLKLGNARERPPVEMKSLMPWTYSAVRAAEDFTSFWWTKKYLAQIQIYILGCGEADWGLFWVTNLAGQWKPLEVELDPVFAERVWAFAESAVDAVAAYRARGVDALPGYSKDAAECARCPFFGRRCNPPLEELGAEFLKDPALEVDLVAWSEGKVQAADWRRLDESIKERFKTLHERTKKPLAVVGEFMIKMEERSRKGYSVKAGTSVWTSIQRRGKSEENGG